MSPCLWPTAPPKDGERVIAFEPTSRERRWIAKLHGQYVRYALQYWQGKLPPVPIRISWRMRRRIAALEWHEQGFEPIEIAVSGTDILRFGWKAVNEALLHEMIHVFQCRAGMAPNHGAAFRAEATRLHIWPHRSERLHPLKRATGTRPA